MHKLWLTKSVVEHAILFRGGLPFVVFVHPGIANAAPQNTTEKTKGKRLPCQLMVSKFYILTFQNMVQYPVLLHLCTAVLLMKHNLRDLTISLTAMFNAN